MDAQAANLALQGQEESLPFGLNAASPAVASPESSSRLRDPNRQSNITSSGEVTPPPILATKIYNGPPQENQEQAQLIVTMQGQKARAGSHEPEEPYHPNRIPVEVKIGVVVPHQQNPSSLRSQIQAQKQNDPRQDDRTEQGRTNAESGADYQYFSQQLSNKLDHKNLTGNFNNESSNHQTLQNYFNLRGDQNHLSDNTSGAAPSKSQLNSRNKQQRLRTQQNGRVKKNLHSFDKGGKPASTQRMKFWETGQPQHANMKLKMQQFTGRQTQGKLEVDPRSRDQHSSKWQSMSPNVFSVASNSQVSNRLRTENVLKGRQQAYPLLVQEANRSLAEQAQQWSHVQEKHLVDSGIGPPSIRGRDAQSESRQYNINRRLLQDIQKRMPIYSTPDCNDNYVQTSPTPVINWQQEGMQQTRINNLREGINASVPPHLIADVHEELSQRISQGHRGKLDIRLKKKTLELAVQSLVAKPGQAGQSDKLKPAEQSPQQRSFNLLTTTRDLEGDEVQVPPSLGITPRDIASLQEKTHTAENGLYPDKIHEFPSKFGSDFLSASFLSQNFRTDPRRSQFSVTSHRINTSHQTTSRCGEKISPERLDDKTIACQKEWTKKPFEVLKRLEKEVFINYEMFEKPEGQRSSLERRSLEEPIGKEQMILMIQKALEVGFEVRQLPHPQVKMEDVLVEASLLYRRVINQFRADKETQLSLSMLWKYVVSMLDSVLAKSEEKVENVRKFVDRKVDERVAIALKKTDLEKIELQANIDKLKKELAEKEHSLSSKTEYLQRLQENMKKVNASVEALKDPTGLRDFRKLLDKFIVDINYITEEKEQQYTTMKQVVAIMENMGEEKALAESKLAEVAARRERQARQQLERMQQEQEEFRKQQEEKQTVSVKVANPDKEARRQRRQAMMAQALEQTQTQHDEIRDLALSEELKQILAIAGIESEEVIQGLKSALAHDLEPVIEKRVKGEIGFMLKTKLAQLQNGKDAARSGQHDPKGDISQLLELYVTGKVDFQTLMTQERDGAELRDDLRDPQVDSDASSQKGSARNGKKRSTRFAATLDPKSRQKIKDLGLSGDGHDSSTGSLRGGKRRQTTPGAGRRRGHGSDGSDNSDGIDGRYNTTGKKTITISEASESPEHNRRRHGEGSPNAKKGILKKSLEPSEDELRGENSQDSLGGTVVNLKRVKAIKKGVNAGLEKALGARSKQAIKKTLKDMKNPILTSIKKTLSLPNHELTKDYYISMDPAKILQLLDEIMREKVVKDLENEDGPIQSRHAAPFHQFMYDSMIMRFGLQSIAIKTLIQMSNGLNSTKRKMQFAHLLNKMLGLGIPPLRLDEIQIVLRTHIFFKIVQEEWLTRLKTNHSYLPLTKDSEANLDTGGDCLVFDMLDELKVAFRHDKEIQEHILTNLKPDVLFEKRPDRQDLELQYLILKVTNRIAKMGKDTRWVFEQFDTDGNGTLDAREILMGIKSVLGIYFSKEETNMFVRHLDDDNSGDIDMQEFMKKITLNDLHKDSHKFLISEVKLIDQVLTEWYHYKSREQKQLRELIKEYDTNNDGVMQLDEFKEILLKLEPDMDQTRILPMFREAFSQSDSSLDAIEPGILADMIMDYKLGGHGREFFSQYLKKRKSGVEFKRKKAGKVIQNI